MRTENISPSNEAPENRALAALLRAAKKLHRQAGGESLATSLPVLRRIIESGTLRGLSLPQLRRRRDIVQRKHILQMLALEAGHVDWKAYRSAAALMNTEELMQLDVLASSASYPNQWFSSFDEAEQYAQGHGGVPVRVGKQGVVLVH